MFTHKYMLVHNGLKCLPNNLLFVHKFMNKTYVQQRNVLEQIQSILVTFFNHRFCLCIMYM